MTDENKILHRQEQMEAARKEFEAIWEAAVIKRKPGTVLFKLEDITVPAHCIAWEVFKATKGINQPPHND